MTQTILAAFGFAFFSASLGWGPDGLITISAGGLSKNRLADFGATKEEASVIRIGSVTFLGS